MPKGTKLAFTSPEGRLVQGDAFEMNTKDKTGAPRLVKSGPNMGQPAPQMVLVVAFAKTDPAWPAFERQLKSKAAEDFPQLFPGAARGDFTPSHPNFSFKIQDGDGFDGDGKPNNVKEGHAGHWIVKFTSGFAAKVFNKGHYAPQEQVFKVPGQPAPGPRRGDYVRISGTIEGNDDAARPAIFVNCSLVEFSRAGVEIVSGPSAEAAFGGGGAATIDHSHTPGLHMLNGQSYEAFRAAGWTDDQMIAAGHATRPAPVAPPAPPVPPVPAAPAGIVPNPGVDLAAYRAAGWTDDQLVSAGHATRPPVPQPAAPPPPAAGVPIPPVSTPPVPAAPSATPSPSNPPAPPYSDFRQPPAPPGKTMLPAAGGATYEQMIGMGWTDAQLIQHGMMAA